MMSGVAQDQASDLVKLYHIFGPQRPSRPRETHAPCSFKPWRRQHLHLDGRNFHDFLLFMQSSEHFPFVILTTSSSLSVWSLRKNSTKYCSCRASNGSCSRQVQTNRHGSPLLPSLSPLLPLQTALHEVNTRG